MFLNFEAKSVHILRCPRVSRIYYKVVAIANYREKGNQSCLCFIRFVFVVRSFFFFFLVNQSRTKGEGWSTKK